MSKSKMICINDGQATRRESKSVIDLFLVSRKLYNTIRTCMTLSHEKVQSDHIAVLLDIDFGTTEYDESKIDKEQFWNIKKCDWSKWDESTKEMFSKLKLNDEDIMQTVESLKIQ